MHQPRRAHGVATHPFATKLGETIGKKFYDERVRFERVRRARRVAVCGFRKSLIRPTVLVRWEMSEIFSFRGMNQKTPRMIRRPHSP